MKASPLPSLDYLRECFEYNPQSGCLTWRERPLSHFMGVRQQRRWNKLFAGRPAGWVDGGYLRVKINAKEYLAHRVGFALGSGIELCPDDIVDHENRNTIDNSFPNLRKATSQQNAWNCRGRQEDLPKGVSRKHQRTGGVRYMGRIRSGREINVGTFTTPEEAAEAVRLERSKLHGKFGRD